MANEKKQAPEESGSEEKTKKEKTVAIYNRGKRVYSTSHGSLEPGKMIEVPESEAKSLVDYHDLIDASKMVKPSPSHKVLQDQIAELTEKNQQLTEELEKLTKKGNK